MMTRRGVFFYRFHLKHTCAYSLSFTEITHTCFKTPCPAEPNHEYWVADTGQGKMRGKEKRKFFFRIESSSWFIKTVAGATI